jgi:UDP-N-acetylglucosamine--N-acetylmuramyl-(pentapeptide) pyrophosphoryl-undecaprenol N-acetylglucosamine transferase
MKRIVVIAGGGTGGHIYPGIAIAKSLEKLNKDIEIHFVGSSLGLETKIVPREGYPLYLLPAGKLNYEGETFAKIKTLFKVFLAFIKSIFWLIKYKPEFILGVGGYASGPFVFAATLLNFETAIWEPNAHPGLTNRILSRWVKKCYLVFEEAKSFLNCRNIMKMGLPVRPELEELQQSQREDSNFHVLCFGGSQGARYINKILSQSVASEPQWLHKAKLIHQTGVQDFEEIDKAYKSSIFSVTAYEFLHEMDKFYDWADIVICRSGASTVAELAAVGKPAVLIPLPSSADDHQKKNAQVVVKMGAAIMFEQNQLNIKSLNELILELQRNPEKLKYMSENMKILHQPKAANAIAKDILEIMASKNIAMNSKNKEKYCETTKN